MTKKEDNKKESSDNQAYLSYLTFLNTDDATDKKTCDDKGGPANINKQSYM